MKTIIFTSFGLGVFVSNFATTHPNLFYLALSILAGFILAVLTSLVFIGPTPKPPAVQTQVKRQPNVTQTPVRKTAKQQPKKTNFQVQHGIKIINYPQGAYA